jgi:hypothetical protein
MDLISDRRIEGVRAPVGHATCKNCEQKRAERCANI